jgi:long-chain acyl-CoA synthetase
MGLTMIQGYGMTECSPIITLNRDRYNKPASAGVPMPGAELQIIDKDENGIGEIICRSDSVMIGYYDEPEETAEAVIDGWLHTGDYGRLDAEGFLYITGRKKNLIVTKNGKNISPEELETSLYKIPLVADAVVWGKDDPKSGDLIICADILPDYNYVRTVYGADVGIEEIKKLLKIELDRLNEKYPLYKRIKRFAIREQAFEKTSTQKIKRYKIRNDNKQE